MARDPPVVDDDGREVVLTATGHTPLITQQLSPQPAQTEQTTTRRSPRRLNLKSFLLKQADKAPPMVKEHLITMVEVLARACRSWTLWIVAAVIGFLIIQGFVLQTTADLEDVRLQPQKVRSMQQLEFEDSIDSAYRQWKALQEANPKKFANFSKFLLDTKSKESHLRKKLSALSEESMQLLSNIVVPPAGPKPDYNKDEAYELTWSYLMPEKSWPYVGSERWLEEFKNDTRPYYNSLAVFPHNDRRHMHGLAGIWPNGTRAWIPGPMPPPIAESPDGKEAELKNGGFYLKLSNALPVDREVPDLRPQFCREVKYDITKMEDASVVIVYYNEHLSTLLRTVHSVLNNTPPPILREIILVDDHSNVTNVAAGGHLDEYVKLLPKTKILRLPERRGIVQGRIAGAKIAKAPIFVILDSHVEVNPGWLEPQIHRLMESPRSVVFPRILGIEPETLEYSTASGIGCKLSFKWMMQERPYFDPVESPDPVPSASMAGGLFAVRRDWFFEIGAYDEEMKMWGAENVEMGFRYWQCGGRVECLPCSYTYHIYRKGGGGYRSPGEYISKNRVRTAMLWTDKYYQLIRHFVDLNEVDDGFDAKSKKNEKGEDKAMDAGSFEKFKDLRRRFQCKSFSWFLKNVDPDRQTGNNWSDYGLLGSISNVEKNLCVDNLQKKEGGSPYGIYTCHGMKGSQGWFEIKSKHQIHSMSNEHICITNEIKINFCDKPEVDSRWKIDPVRGWIAFANSEADLASNDYENKYKCLGLTDNHQSLTMRPCEEGQKLIQWKLEIFNWDPDYKGPAQMIDPEYDPYDYDELPFPHELPSKEPADELEEDVVDDDDDEFIPGAL